MEYLYRQAGMVLNTIETDPEQYIPSEEEETLEDEGFLEDGDDDPTLPSHYIHLEPPPPIETGIAATEQLEGPQTLETEAMETEDDQSQN